MPPLFRIRCARSIRSKPKKVKLKSWELRLSVWLKIVQIGAFFVAGLWALYSTYLLHKNEAIRSATRGCFTTTTLKVDPMPGRDGEKSLYLVTVDTLTRNDTDRQVSISNYTLDVYVGKTLADAKPGFFVSRPREERSVPTIDWKHFGRFASIQREDFEALQQIRDNKQPNRAEPIAISKESDVRVETFSLLRLGARQSWTFENKFVVSASESDWIASDSLLIYDKGMPFQGDVPETRIENIATAVHKGSQIALKSPPPNTNAGTR